MYDTARRVALVKQRVRENTRRRQRRGIYGLSAACMLLFAVLTQAAGTAVGPGQPEAWGAFGAMLLREAAGGYVLVAVVSFAAAAAITALCFRLRNREFPLSLRYSRRPRHAPGGVRTDRPGSMHVRRSLPPPQTRSSAAASAPCSRRAVC